MNLREFLVFAIKFLRNSAPGQFGRDFCNLKMLFFHKFQEGKIFSTRFGADFFDEVLERLNHKEFIKPPPGGKLAVYDENFNLWLSKQIGKEK